MSVAYFVWIDPVHVSRVSRDDFLAILRNVARFAKRKQVRGPEIADRTIEYSRDKGQTEHVVISCVIWYYADDEKSPFAWLSVDFHKPDGHIEYHLHLSPGDGLVKLLVELSKKAILYEVCERTKKAITELCNQMFRRAYEICEQEKAELLRKIRELELLAALR